MKTFDLGEAFDKPDLGEAFDKPDLGEAFDKPDLTSLLMEARERYCSYTTNKYDGVKRYDKEINYNSGDTIHYQYRTYRKQRLTSQLGEGERVDAFLIDDGDGALHIQEVMSNAIINVYSHETHKRITVFAPQPNRIKYLYQSVGELAPDFLIKKSICNTNKGLNNICCII